jgi:hypothetical protein
VCKYAVVKLLLDFALEAVPPKVKLFKLMQEFGTDIKEPLQAFRIVLYLLVVLLNAHINAELLLLHLFELVVDDADVIVQVIHYVFYHRFLCGLILLDLLHFPDLVQMHFLMDIYKLLVQVHTEVWVV